MKAGGVAVAGLAFACPWSSMCPKVVDEKIKRLLRPYFPDADYLCVFIQWCLGLVAD